MKPALKFAVDRGIAVPSKAAPTPYPFDDMKIGDSFLIPYETENPSERAISWNRAQTNVQQAFRNWRMNNPRKRSKQMLTTRSTDDGLRCWLHERPW